MAIFGPKPLAKCQSFYFLNFLFFQPRKAFFRSRISQNTFSWSKLCKKKVGKMAILGPKPWVNPLEKSHIFDFFNLLFLQPRKAFSLSRMSQNTFSWSIMCKKKSWKNRHIGPKPWVNPFGKMSMFRLFEFLVFIAYKVVFSFQNII